MEQGAQWVSEPVTFATSDGVTLHGDLAVPVTAPSASATGLAHAAIVCHPHPQYGGDRFNPVVEHCWRALADRGIQALRFDFRAEFGGGVAERLDAAAAVDALRQRTGGTVAAVGYSFGAMVVLGLDTAVGVAARVLIAPPLGMMPIESPPTGPTLVLTPVGDQFAPPDVAEPIVDSWRETNPDVTFETVPMADHFLAGHTTSVATRTATYLQRSGSE